MRSRRASDATWSVVADVVYSGVVSSRVVGGGVVDDRVGYATVVDLYVTGIHIVRCTVVIEAVSVPITALITGTGVTISVIDAAVVADVPTPIAIVIAIAVAAVGISPPSGRPQITRFGRARPRAWNPVEAV